MSHRQKIVYMQIGAITVAIFLALLVGAAALTKALNRREAQTDQKNAKQEQQEEKIASEDDNSADSTSGDSRQGNRFLSRSVWWVTVRWERI